MTVAAGRRRAGALRMPFRAFCPLAEGGTGYFGTAGSNQLRSDQMAVGHGQPDQPGTAVWIDPVGTLEFLPTTGYAQVAVVAAGRRARVDDDQQPGPPCPGHDHLTSMRTGRGTQYGHCCTAVPGDCRRSGDLV